MSESAGRPFVEFVHTPAFDADAADILTDDDLRALQAVLAENPHAGAMMAGTGGFRKVRAARPGHGKRGGARVVYLYVEAEERIYLVLAYAKGASETVTEAGKKYLRRIARELRGEH